MKNIDRSLKRYRKICLSLLETEEVETWGHPTFRVGAGRKIFASFGHHEDRPCIGMKVGMTRQKVLLGDERFFRPPYVGHKGWVSLWVDGRVDWDLVEDLVTGSYRLIAPKTLSKKLDEMTGGSI